jgi:hypothetical protein
LEPLSPNSVSLKLLPVRFSMPVKLSPAASPVLRAALARLTVRPAAAVS